jgi:serine/threonine protein kinase
MALTTPKSPFATPAERLDSLFDSTEPDAAFGDTAIDEVARLLRRCGQHAASKCPRTYIILRTINELQVLDQILGAGFRDHWFPVGGRGHSLPASLDPRIKTLIVNHQGIIMSKSLDFEHGRHCLFGPGEPLPFEIGDLIGSGGSGQVNKIVSKISFKEYALKRIHKRSAFGHRYKSTIREIVGEIEIMRTLEHRHIVEYLGSYTDKAHLGLIISPVAHCDLATYMQETCTEPRKRNTLRTFFGCLATALCYLHDNSIKHRDIKPQNILVHRSNILITDFGLSRDYLDTTSGPTLVTPRYCSPEIAAHESRNMSTDIWSLGCVYLEIVAALQGYDIDWLRGRFVTTGTTSTHYYGNREAAEELLEEWAASGGWKETIPLSWIRAMLQVDRNARPTAAQVVEMIMGLDNSEHSAITFCCIDCAFNDQSDSSVSLIEHPSQSPNHNGQITEVAVKSAPATESTDSDTALQDSMTYRRARERETYFLWHNRRYVMSHINIQEPARTMCSTHKPTTSQSPTKQSIDYELGLTGPYSAVDSLETQLSTHNLSSSPPINR